MNAKVSELTLQALAESCTSDISNGFASKFAELIVLECTNQIEKNYVGAIGTHASAHNTAVKRCSEQVKQHFGIKE